MKGRTLPSSVHPLIELHTGVFRLHGTARVTRHRRVGAASWKRGVAAPTAGFVGVFPTLAFAAGADNEAHFTVIVPYAWDDTVGIAFAVDWLFQGAPNAGGVAWALEYKAVKAGDVVVGAGVTILQASGGGHTTGQMVRTVFGTLLLAANLERHDTLGFRLYRDVSDAGDTLPVGADLINTHFHFTKNRLGEPV